MKEGQLNAKMLGALLTGVNRAFPFLKGVDTVTVVGCVLLV